MHVVGEQIKLAQMSSAVTPSLIPNTGPFYLSFPCVLSLHFLASQQLPANKGFCAFIRSCCGVSFKVSQLFLFLHISTVNRLVLHQKICFLMWFRLS